MRGASTLNEGISKLSYRMGKASAASAVARLKLSYTGLQQAFLVGVCGGVPKTHDGVDIMLGDVIIGKTIVQYGFGKKYPDKFVRKFAFKESFGAQKKDTQSILAMIETIRGRDKIRRTATKFLSRLKLKAAEHGYGAKYVYTGLAKDELFEPSYRHKHHKPLHCICKDCREPTSPVCDEAINTSCNELGCNTKYLVPRFISMNRQGQERVESDGAQILAIHVGSIASGDTVMKSGVDRDRIAEREGIIAFEMEAAGIWEEIPCIVLKGVSDYADSHKQSD
ncbi:hypothetical protein TARUN_1151 [Trichoderma arundinaceum]|uniref:Uncharacterized protein n=1 Tax=Trichoderma arundinaceum TaxID=490622 RepID=A0A395NYA2_TRIAR|nr:hypothetical protein TARUN_1151 [Trichoderma arundinaceum]